MLGGGKEALVHICMLPGAGIWGDVRDVEKAIYEQSNGTELIVAGAFMPI